MIKTTKDGEYYVVERNGEEVYRSKYNPKSLIEACQKEFYCNSGLRRGDVVSVTTIYKPQSPYKAIIYGSTQDDYWLLTDWAGHPIKFPKDKCNLECLGKHIDLDSVFR